MVSADTDTDIVDQWIFGDVTFRLYKVDTLYTLRCISHEPYSDIQFTLLSTPIVKLIQIENRIYVWFVDFLCFNTDTFTFENVTDYLYAPIHKIVTNGIESESESKNFLTETYRKRHQYSAMSSVNFEKLVGRDMNIGLNGKHLYDITVQKKSDAHISIFTYRH